MAKIAVARTSFEAGTFPPVCCVTGTHTDRYAGWDFGKRMHGVLPMSLQAERRVARMHKIVWVLGFFCVVALVAAGITQTTAVVVGAAMLAVVWIVCVALAISWTPNAKRLGDEAIELSHVHEHFVGTIKAAWAQREQA